MPSINIVNRYGADRGYRKVIRGIIKAAVRHLQIRGKLVVSVILVANEEIREYNRTYRGIDAPTDVLSFPNNDSLEEVGDIFISLDKVAEQAETLGHRPARELAFLALHGFLHCLGYDHLNPEDEAEMTALQQQIIENTKYKKVQL